MKIDKQLQKKYISAVKEHAVKTGYKKIQNTIYKIENGKVVFVPFVVVNSECLVYTINIKKKSFDEIFWKVMGMEENLNARESLCVNGAFIAPSIIIAEGYIDFSEDIDGFVASFLKKVDEEINKFIEKYDIAEYIFSGNIKSDEGILKCLSYIDSGLLPEAKRFAEKQILLGDKGRFENEGKGFYERVLLYNG